VAKLLGEITMLLLQNKTTTLEVLGVERNPDNTEDPFIRVKYIKVTNRPDLLGMEAKLRWSYLITTSYGWEMSEPLVK